MSNQVNKSQSSGNNLPIIPHPFNLFNLQDRSLLIVTESSKLILISLENESHIDCLDLIKMVSNNYESLFVTAINLEKYNEKYWLCYDVSKLDLLEISKFQINSLSSKEKVSLFRDFIEIIIRLNLLHEDFESYDNKLFFMYCQNGLIRMKYLYHCKKIITNLMYFSVFIQRREMLVHLRSYNNKLDYSYD